MTINSDGVVLNVPFKGKRDYLQSGDLWDATVAALREAGGAAPGDRLSMRFRRLVSHAVCLMPFEGRRPAEMIADVVLRGGDGARTFLLAETEREVAERRDDHEATVLDRLEVDGDSGRVSGPFAVSPIEAIVAATKGLHLASVDGSVKWLATRLDLPLGLALDGELLLEVRIRSRTDRQATVSEVLHGGELLGTIGFNPKP